MFALLTHFHDEISNNLVSFKKVPGSTAHLFYLCALNSEGIVQFGLRTTVGVIFRLFWNQSCYSAGRTPMAVWVCCKGSPPVIRAWLLIVPKSTESNGTFRVQVYRLKITTSWHWAANLVNQPHNTHTGNSPYHRAGIIVHRGIKPPYLLLRKSHYLLQTELLANFVA